jgi:hypothetical protein
MSAVPRVLPDMPRERETIALEKLALRHRLVDSDAVDQRERRPAVRLRACHAAQHRSAPAPAAR